jgi:hypothetical protein
VLEFGVAGPLSWALSKKMPSVLRFLFKYRVLAAAGLSFGAVAVQGQSHYEPYYFGRLAGNAPGRDDGIFE